MISYLKGTIIEKNKNYLIIETGGVGYKVFAAADILSAAVKGKTLEIFIYQQTSDQGVNLFGLNNLIELELFELLVSVSGVGPKTALSVFNTGSADDIKMSIFNGDPYLLNKVSGIGKKTAERIILELGGKILSLTGDMAVADSSLNDEIEALMALGYSFNQANTTLKKIDKNCKNSSDRVKQALKILGSK